MEFITTPTEQTTAITDAILGVVALGAALFLLGLRRHNRWKAGVWATALGFLAFASLLGAIVHGFKMPAATSQILWIPLNLALGLTVALFVVGAIYDRWGLNASRRSLIPLLIVGALFVGLRVALPSTFLVFIAYEGVAMLFALGIYGSLAIARRMHGAWLMTAGIVITLIAAGIQASSLTLTVVWPFDHNGLFHLIQIVGVLALVAGLRRSLTEEQRPAMPVSGAAESRQAAHAI